MKNSAVDTGIDWKDGGQHQPTSASVLNMSSDLRKIYSATCHCLRSETIPLQSLIPNADPGRLRQMFDVIGGDGTKYNISNSVEMLRHSITAYSDHIELQCESMSDEEVESEIARIEIWQARLNQLTTLRLVDNTET